MSPDEAVSVEQLYSRAVKLAEGGQHVEAATAFDRIAALDPDGPLAPHALFGAGESHDQAGQLEQAAARYQQIARRFMQGPLARTALVRAVRLFAYLEQWPETRDAAELLLRDVKELSLIEAIVAHSGRAIALISSSDPQSARYDIEKARGLVERARLDQAGRLPTDLAVLYFALGELRRLKSESILFDPPPEQFAQVLEERCQLLLDAQGAYSDAMRAYDAHWSAMAGFRVGELYQRLHADLMKVHPPESANTPERAQLFEGAMRLRYSVLLEKGLAMMDHTVQMAERTGERSAWVLRARRAQADLKGAMEREEKAIDRLPYTREDLERALEDLKQRALARQVDQPPGS